jgi:hypothetical protein
VNGKLFAIYSLEMFVNNILFTYFKDAEILQLDAPCYALQNKKM